MTKLTIELKDLISLGEDGKTFFFNPKAEASIAQLLQLQAKVEETIQKVKKSIAEEGLKETPAFNGVRGSKVRASYRPFGAAYKITAKDVEKTLSPDLFNKSITYRPNTEGINAYVETKGGLPSGIDRVEREKQIVFKEL